VNILQKANEIVNERAEEKERTYGPIADCSERTAKIMSVLSKKEITILDVYYFHIASKLAREAFAHKEDNLLDAAAYIGALNNFHEH